MKRFPGPKPYSDQDTRLFFGRDDDKEKLSDIIKSNRLTVLFGRSGYGKSSLIQAGIIPHFKNDLNYQIIDFRFTAVSQNKKPLYEQLAGKVVELLNGEELLLNELPDGGLWQRVKTFQWKARRENYNGLLLVLDQFEEIFAFPDEYPDLAKSISHLIFNYIPERFQEALYRKMQPPRGGDRTSKTEFHAANEEKIAFLKESFPFSILIGIRSDRLYLLEELGENIPTVFTNRFQLRPLTIDNVEPIVKKAGTADGDFESPKMDFEPEVILKIKKYLATNNDSALERNAIEAFELQIICEYAETMATKTGLAKVSVKDLLPDNLDDVVRNYYKTIITGGDPPFTEYERLATRFLIERKLITKNNVRVCLDRGSMQSLILSDELLYKIIQTKIVRRVQNTASGLSYELSHDTLVSPILVSASKDLPNLDRTIGEYYGRYPKALKHVGIKERHFVDDNNKLAYVVGDSMEVRATPIVRHNIVQEIKPGVFMLNELFQDLVIKRMADETEGWKRIVLKALIFLGVLFVAVVFILTSLVKRYEPELAFRIASLTPVSSKLHDKNSVDSASLTLLVFDDAYKKTAKTNFSGIPGDKLVQQFNHSLLFASKRGMDSLFVKKVIHSSDHENLSVLYSKHSVLLYDNIFRDLTVPDDDVEGNTLTTYDRGPTKKSMTNVIDADYLGNDLLILSAQHLIWTNGTDTLKIGVPDVFRSIAGIERVTDKVALVILTDKQQKGVLGRLEYLHHLFLLDLGLGTLKKLTAHKNEYTTYIQRGNVLEIKTQQQKDTGPAEILVYDLTGNLSSFSIRGKHYPMSTDQVFNLDEIGFGIPIIQDNELAFYDITTLKKNERSQLRLPLGKYPSYKSIGKQWLSLTINDTINIYNKDLGLIKRQPFEQAYRYQVRVSGEPDHFNFLFFHPDFFNGGKIYLSMDGKADDTLTVHNLWDAWLSSTGNGIFTFNYAQDGTTSVVLYNLESGTKMGFVKPLPPYHGDDQYNWTNKIFFLSSDSLMEVDLESERVRDLANMDAASVSAWMEIHGIEKQLSDSLGADRIRRVRMHHDMNGWHKIVDILFPDNQEGEKK